LDVPHDAQKRTFFMGPAPLGLAFENTQAENTARERPSRADLRAAGDPGPHSTPVKKGSILI
jgi:hypothetical protein